MITTWTIRPFAIDGTPQSYTDYYGISQNNFKHSTGRQLEFALNGLDALTFTMYLDDPGAALIRRLSTIVKVWRNVYSSSGSLYYADSSPCFAGVVAQTNKAGAAGTMTIRAFSPLWRLQSRFHLLNHYLKINEDTDSEFTQSELMWKLIDLVNNAFGSESFTGIAEGTFGWGAEPIMAPYFVGKGTNTWANIFDDIMTRPGGVDIIPSYVHSDGDPTLMNFDTDEKRGADISGSQSWDYRTGNKNLDDLNEAVVVNPGAGGGDRTGSFGNFLWAVGQGGPNSGKIAQEENISSSGGSDGTNEIGVYMVRVDRQEVKRIGIAGPPPTHLKAIAQAEFAQARQPETAYEVEISPARAGDAGSASYGADWGIGDVVALNADKGALQVSGVKQRVYTATLNQSDNNVETVSVTIANDFYGKVAT